ncbi:MAG: hypothetical protein SGCHY_000094 [Lobulomycetales sp.]
MVVMLLLAAAFVSLALFCIREILLVPKRSLSLILLLVLALVKSTSLGAFALLETSYAPVYVYIASLPTALNFLFAYELTYLPLDKDVAGFAEPLILLLWMLFLLTTLRFIRTRNKYSLLPGERLFDHNVHVKFPHYGAVAHDTTSPTDMQKPFYRYHVLLDREGNYRGAKITTEVYLDRDEFMDRISFPR